MNQKKIAKLLHVSPSTVSKALSGNTEISRETSEMIQQFAIDTGYFKEKSKRKRDYTDNCSLLIALIVPEIMGFHYSSLITFMKNEIESRNGHVTIYISDFSNDKANDILKSIILHGAIDGIIMFDVPHITAKSNIPIVTVSPRKGSDFDSVIFDSKAIIEDAVSYLINLGHRKIGFVGETHTLRNQELFKETMKEKKLPVYERFIYTIPCRFEEIGERAAMKILSQKERPTALIAAYDEIAISLTSHLDRNGIKIPDDISVMGINNIPSAKHAQVPLTTIDTFSSEQYKAALDLLFDKILNETDSVKHITIQHKLIERETTKRLEETKDAKRHL